MYVCMNFLIYAANINMYATRFIYLTIIHYRLASVLWRFLFFTSIPFFRSTPASKRVAIRRTLLSPFSLSPSLRISLYPLSPNVNIPLLPTPARRLLCYEQTKFVSVCRCFRGMQPGPARQSTMQLGTVSEQRMIEFGPKHTDVPQIMRYMIWYLISMYVYILRMYVFLCFMSTG